jgi:hypothetical protein
MYCAKVDVDSCAKLKAFQLPRKPKWQPSAFSYPGDAYLRLRSDTVKLLRIQVQLVDMPEPNRSRRHERAQVEVYSSLSDCYTGNPDVLCFNSSVKTNSPILINNPLKISQYPSQLS